MRTQGHRIVFLLEERSAEEMLRKFVPRCFPGLSCVYRCFSGKPELLKRLEKTIRNHPDADCRFVVVCDQDGDDCVTLKTRILALCGNTGHVDRCVACIACRELESWYLAQLNVVGAHFGCSTLGSRQNTYASPDTIPKPSKVLERLTGRQYQKVKGSRIMGQYLNPAETRSASFTHLVSVLKRFEQ